ncbi:MAG: hypothetical protein J2P28_00895 [Actinobacteria bacterium]|nr:hypothetical protein [Actinomycetota bacterium]MBO0834058.1 hypothetical protein [Actinomycetota bacterium]
MASDLVTGVLVLVGTGLGSFATLTGTWMATRKRRLMGERGAARRQVYADYLGAADKFTERARVVVAAMENGAQLKDCEAVFRAYAADWETYQRTCAPVLIAGPAEVGSRASDLRGQLAAMADECDRLYKSYMDAPGRKTRAAKFPGTERAVQNARDKFIAAAQTHAYGSKDRGRPAPASRQPKPAPRSRANLRRAS